MSNPSPMRLAPLSRRKDSVLCCSVCLARWHWFYPPLEFSELFHTRLPSARTKSASAWPLARSLATSSAWFSAKDSSSLSLASPVASSQLWPSLVFCAACFSRSSQPIPLLSSAPQSCSLSSPLPPATSRPAAPCASIP